MATESWLETDENKTLLAICARKAIRGYGIAGVIWGAINIAIGVAAIEKNVINAAILVLAALMIGAGINCLTRRNVTSILLEAIVNSLLLAWNVAVAVINTSTEAPFDVRGIILPFIVAILLFKEYGQLRAIADLLAAVRPDQIKQAEQTCKAILKKSWKDDPSVALVQASSFVASGQARLQRMEGKVFFVKGNLSRAFVMPDAALSAALRDPNLKKAKIAVRHPLGKITIALDRKNTDRVRSWLQPAASAQMEQGIAPA